MKVVDARTYFGVGLEAFTEGGGLGNRGNLRQRALRDGVKLLPMTEIAPGDPLPARVDHNRWIVDCPDCNGAQNVWLETLVTMCPACWNQAVGGKWRRVAVPANYREIEAALMARPLAMNRHWRPGEAVKDLHIENVAHGLPAAADVPE